MNNLFAYTAPGANYPPYISVNIDDRFGGLVTITVRSVALEAGVCGPTAEITLNDEQVKELAEALKSAAI